MFQIYRIEHKKTQIGPFQTNDIFTQYLAKKANENPHLKFPTDDGLPLGFIPFCFVFGSLTLANLKSWFSLDKSLAQSQFIIENLTQKGFVLAEFLVQEEDCRIGISQTQVAFDASSAKEEGLVAYHALNVLLN